ncbi:ATP-dependent DNA helicase DDX31-like isoform X2 [Branchiostoma lanceolatum]|uniref:ATP-dependent DNA helicase DDX31-like isoform X2 n=1 Tax=Branchiostoma lanceolatum TaxID=7740 RepID=UPI0034554173
MTNMDNESSFELNLVSNANVGAPGRAAKQDRGWREKKKRRNQKRTKFSAHDYTSPSKRRRVESDSGDEPPPDLLQPNQDVKSSIKSNPMVQTQRTEKLLPSPKFKKKEVKLSQSKKKVVKLSQSKPDSTTDHGGKFPQGKGVISSLFRYNPEIPVVAQETVQKTKEEVFSADKFGDLNLHPFMIKNLEENLMVTKTTSVQKDAIPVLLQGKDALVKSQTGSGKTLAYSIPVVQHLQAKKQKTQRSDGPYAIVLVPTRELAIQTHDVIQKLVKPFCWIVPGCIIGGERRKAEKARLRKGINIIVATPGRLVDHIQNTQSLQLGRVEWLILDEADRLLDMGFEKDIRAIFSGLNDRRGSTVRQNVLLSATLSEGVERLAGMSLNNPVKITVSKDVPSEKKQTSLEEDKSAEETFVTPAELKQSFILVPSKLRLVTLAAFILWKCKFGTHEKMLVFLSTQDSVDFHHHLLKNILNDEDDDAEFGGHDITFSRLHGNMTQQDRTEVFQQFREAKSGVLLCTDVAARGLHLPKVSWIVQYNTPGSATDYIHRAGRTARIGRQGHALLFLMPSEVEFVKVLATNNISMEEMAMEEVLKTLFIHSKDSGKKKTTKPGAAQQAVQEAATSLQMAFENYVLSDQDKLAMARKAYQSFIRAYATFPSTLKHIFHVRKLHLGHVAKSYGLRDAPGDIGNLVAGSKSSKKGLAEKKTSKSQMLKDARKGKQQKTRLDMMSEFSSGL